MKKINLLLALCLMLTGSLALAMDNMDKESMGGGSMKMEAMQPEGGMKMEGNNDAMMKKGNHDTMMKQDTMGKDKMEKQSKKSGKKHKSKQMKKKNKADDMQGM